MALDEPNENDNRFNLSGIELLVEEKLNPFLEGQMIDFVNFGYGEDFVISPEGGSSCA